MNAADKQSEIIEFALVKAFGEIGKYDYYDKITEKLRIHELIDERQCQEIRYGKLTTEEKNMYVII